MSSVIEYKHYCVFSAKLARRLLQKCFTIVDIKANDSDLNKTVFVFKFEDGLLQEIDRYKNEVRRLKNSHSESQ